MANNNPQNVSVGKPKVLAQLFVAPIGTTLPTDPTTALEDEFVNVGYISDAGVTDAIDSESTEFIAWGTDVVLTSQTSHNETFQFVMIETNETSLGVYYGDDNVTSTTGAITVKVNGQESQAQSFIIDMVMNGGRVQRIVIPNAKVSERGDTVYVDTDLIGYDTTITALPDSAGNKSYKYISAPSA